MNTKQPPIKEKIKLVLFLQIGLNKKYYIDTILKLIKKVERLPNY